MRSGLATRADFLVLGASESEGRMQLTPGLANRAAIDWIFGTVHNFGIEDERAYLSSAVVKNSNLFMRVLNFDSLLDWKIVSF